MGQKTDTHKTLHLCKVCLPLVIALYTLRNSLSIPGDCSSVRHTIVLLLFNSSSRLILRHPFVVFEAALIILRLSLTDSISERPDDYLWL